MSKKGKIAAGVVVAAVLGGVVYASVTKDSRNRTVVQTQKVAKRDLTSVVSASGEVKPKKFVNISANTSGRIVALLVKEGDRVKAGQVLAKIDSTRIAAGEQQSSAAVQTARAELDRAQADLEMAKSSFERNKRMLAEELISQQQFEQVEAEIKMKAAAVEAQRRRINQSTAVLASNRDDLEKTVVVSPMAGVVTSLVKEEGEVVIGAQSFQPTVIMTVGDLSSFEVEILVDETDIRYVALGQEADIRVDALEGVKIKGEVTEIGSSAIPRGGTQAAGGAGGGTSTANQAKDFKVSVTVKDPPASLRSGLNATADIVTAKKQQVVAVPIQAVVVREVGKDGKVVDPGALQAAEKEPGGGAAPERRGDKGEEKEGVFLYKDGDANFKPVKTGIIGETDIEVTEGVAEGEEIITGSYRTLRTLKDQAKVKLEPKKDKK
jgi:HlyD family secretion protein